MYSTFKNEDQEQQTYDYKSIENKCRMNFVKKVYGIILTQLIVMSFFIMFSLLNDNVSEFLRTDVVIFWICVIFSSIIMFCLMCFSSLARKVPLNYFLLMTFTLMESYLVARSCVLADNPKLVMMAATMTCAMVLALTLYAIVTDTDFTKCGGILFCLCIALLLFSIFAIFTQNKTVQILISVLFVLLFSVYLIFDTQILLGRKQYSLSYDDYILGAMLIYVDIIMIFLNILHILKSS